MSEIHSLKNDGQNLPQLFAKAWKDFLKIEDSTEPSNAEPYQKNVKACMETLMRCTHMVNILGLFSSNENINELSTETLSFLLLPAFLGELSLKVMSKERTKNVTHSLVYFTSFLKHCRDYKVTDKNLSPYIQTKPTMDDDDDERPAKDTSRNQTREEKVERFRESKKLESSIKIIQEKLEKDENSVDESVVREHYMNWLKLWINKAVDNITSSKSELEILEHMDKLRLGKVKPEPPKEIKPFKPILITRDMIQKQVFGAGYKNLPTMTEDEYFEKEVREGKIVLDYDSKDKKPTSKNNEEDPDTPQEGDDKEDNQHDEEKLMKARKWDDYKDTHRRGEGNKERNG